MFCKACGHENDDDARFCKICGNSLINQREEERLASKQNLINYEEKITDDSKNSEEVRFDTAEIPVISDAEFKSGLSKKDIYDPNLTPDSERKSRKTLVALLVSVLIITAALLSYFMYFRFNILEARADSYLKNADYDNAISVYSEVMSKRPRDSVAEKIRNAKQYKGEREFIESVGTDKIADPDSFLKLIEIEKSTSPNQLAAREKLEAFYGANNAQYKSESEKNNYTDFINLLDSYIAKDKENKNLNDLKNTALTAKKAYEDKLAKEKAEKEAKEKAEKERLEKERLEKERLAKIAKETEADKLKVREMMGDFLTSYPITMIQGNLNSVMDYIKYNSSMWVEQSKHVEERYKGRYRIILRSYDIKDISFSDEDRTSGSITTYEYFDLVKPDGSVLAEKFNWKYNFEKDNGKYRLTSMSKQ